MNSEFYYKKEGRDFNYGRKSEIYIGFFDY